MNEADLIAEGQRVVDEIMEIQQTKNRLFAVSVEDRNAPGWLLEFIVRAPSPEEAQHKVERHSTNANGTFHNFYVRRLAQYYHANGVYALGMFRKAKEEG